MTTRWTKPVRRTSEYGPFHIIRLMDGRKEIGNVEWFYDGGPYYPHTLYPNPSDQRFGAYETLDGAKLQVEAETTRVRQ